MRLSVGSLFALCVTLGACSGTSGDNEPAAGGAMDAGPDGIVGVTPADDAETTHDGAAAGATTTPDGTAATGNDAAADNTDATATASDDAATHDAGSIGEPDAGDDAPGEIGDAATALDGTSVRLIGRFDLTNPSAPEAEWSASAMEARFSGTSVSANIGGNGNYFAVLVDGTPEPTLVTDGGASYPIASGLAQGSHDVVVFRRDEAMDGPSQFIGFAFPDAGTLLAPPATPSRRVEIIGDSISVGYGDECTNTSQTFAAATENAYIAYGPIAARSFGADVHVVAWQGKGLYRNVDGTTTDTMPILWQRTIPTDANSTWDPAQWIPDVVVINLGTNDYNASSTDPSAALQTAYLDFAATLRDAYPAAFIFATVGPTLSGTNYTAAETVIANVVAMRAAAGDHDMATVEFPTQDCGADGSGCGCNGHPNAAEQQTMATILEGAIHDAMGW